MKYDYIKYLGCIYNKEGEKKVSQCGLYKKSKLDEYGNKTICYFFEFYTKNEKIVSFDVDDLWETPICLTIDNEIYNLTFEKKTIYLFNHNFFIHVIVANEKMYDEVFFNKFFCRACDENIANQEAHLCLEMD